MNLLLCSNSEDYFSTPKCEVNHWIYIFYVFNIKSRKQRFALHDIKDIERVVIYNFIKITFQRW